MEVVMYTTHCPQCEVLAKKLNQKSIKYTLIDDVALMANIGLSAVPALRIDGGALMNFKESIEWVNSLEV